MTSTTDLDELLDDRLSSDVVDPYAATRRGHQFGPGNPGGPGWPKGKPRTLDFLSIAKKKSRDTGIALEDLVWESLVGLAARATKTGDPAAARLLLDRLCGIQEKPDQTNVQVNVANQVEKGPPVPKAGEFGDYVTRMLGVAVDQGLVRKTAVEVVDEAVAKHQAIDELLS